MNATGPILRQGLVMALVFLAFNLLLWGTEGRTVVFTRMQRIEAEAGRADFVAFGSSLVEAAIAPDSFARSWKGGGPGRILNAGIGASTGIERYIVARRVASLARPGTVFFVGIKSLELADLRFAADRTFSWWDNFGNKSLGFHFDRQVAANLYTGGKPLEDAPFPSVFPSSIPDGAGRDLGPCRAASAGIRGPRIAGGGRQPLWQGPGFCPDQPERGAGV